MKRRWFQVHLASAVAVMLSTASLLGLNMSASEQTYYVDGAGAVIPIQFSQWGWPLPWPDSPWAEGQRYFVSPSIDYYSPVMIDIVVAVTIVILVAVVSEYLIRRRERGRA